MIPIEYFLILAACLFVVGTVGVLTKRNAIVVLMSIEIMLNAANINFVAFSTYYGDDKGWMFALFSMGIAAAEVAVGLAILLNLNRLKDTVDVNEISVLRW